MRLKRTIFTFCGLLLCALPALALDVTCSPGDGALVCEVKDKAPLTMDRFVMTRERQVLVVRFTDALVAKNHWIEVDAPSIHRVFLKNLGGGKRDSVLRVRYLKSVPDGNVEILGTDDARILRFPYALEPGEQAPVVAEKTEEKAPEKIENSPKEPLAAEEPVELVIENNEPEAAAQGEAAEKAAEPEAAEKAAEPEAAEKAAEPETAEKAAEPEAAAQGEAAEQTKENTAAAEPLKAAEFAEADVEIENSAENTQVSENKNTRRIVALGAIILGALMLLISFIGHRRSRSKRILLSALCISEERCVALVSEAQKVSLLRVDEENCEILCNFDSVSPLTRGLSEVELELAKKIWRQLRLAMMQGTPLRVSKADCEVLSVAIYQGLIQDELV